MLNSAKSSGEKTRKEENNWKFDLFLIVKNYLKNESLLSILCFVIQGKGPSKKGLFLNSGENLFGCVWFFTRSLLLVCTHRMKQDRFFASDSKYVVCFKYNFCPEKVFVRFFCICGFIVLCKY